MSTLFLLQAGLLLHIIGLTALTGVSLANYLILRQFRTQYIQDKQKGFAIMQATSELPKVAAIGLFLLILSGATMMAVTGGVYGQQLWFQIKSIFIVLIIAGSVLLTRGLEKRLHTWLLEDIVYGNRTLQIRLLAGKIAYLRLFLLSFIAIIFILSSFRFQ